MKRDETKRAAERRMREWHPASEEYGIASAFLNSMKREEKLISAGKKAMYDMAGYIYTHLACPSDWLIELDAAINAIEEGSK